jgi:hypothetical protein
VVDDFEAKGKRQLTTFRTKSEADDWRSGTRIELKQATHVSTAAGRRVGLCR